MPGRPAKPVAVIALEDKAHRTKKELAIRKQGEKELMTGSQLKESKEVRENPVAHKEFTRLRRLLKSIGKNDDLFGLVLNRYCLLHADELDLVRHKQVTEEMIENLDARGSEMDAEEYFKLRAKMVDQVLKYDRQLLSTRNMMLSIEKENIMTIASGLRSIPKNPDKAKNPLMEALGRRQA